MQCEGRESSYLGVYDLFRIPEVVRIKHNHVPDLHGEEDPDDEWDFPQFKHYEVLICVEATDRLDVIVALCENLGFQTEIVYRHDY